MSETGNFSILCQSQAETEQFAETLALAIRKHDFITLSGDLGSGKTTLARHLIRIVLDDLEAEVPSPTFTLVQPYEGGHVGLLSHYDLYRMGEPEELEELGLDDAIAEGVVLLEWPEMAKDALPKPDLSITIEHDSQSDHRRFLVTGNDDAVSRVRRSQSIREFLDQTGTWQRRHLTGDASARAYETVIPDQGSACVLMNAPRLPDGPPIRDGKPYSSIAHLAEDVTAFVAVNQLLSDHGFRTPTIHHQDLSSGLLLMEDLGAGKIVDDNGEPVEDRYLASVEALAKMHDQSWPDQITVAEGITHHIAPYDREAFLIEVELLTDWYAPYRLGRKCDASERQAFLQIWDDLFDVVDKGEKSLVLRDFHSPNIIWRDFDTGTDRTALIDFQDALIGPSAYDLASLSQDARVTVSPQLEQKLLEHYFASRGDCNRDDMLKIHAIMAAQRATKVLGIFVRLFQRDHKDGYLRHLPRIETYLARNLKHPALAEYRTWIETVLQIDSDN